MGVIGSFKEEHALALTSFPIVFFPRPLPSCYVLPHSYRQYYEPLGLPLHTVRFRLRLIRLALPRHGPCRRVSPVPYSPLQACCSPYPGNALRMYRSELDCGGFRLHRDMSGSAIPLFFCRGCKIHLMLRPACLLPGVVTGLLTSRLGQGALAPCLGPATRRFGAYRGGTCTRWGNTA